MAVGRIVDHEALTVACSELTPLTLGATFTKWSTTSTMPANLTQALAKLAVTAVAATTLATTAFVMPASASTATRTASTTGVETVAEEKYVYAIYARIRECTLNGKRLLVAGFIEKYDCKWDSPGWALWVWV